MQSRHAINTCTVDNTVRAIERSAWIKKVLGRIEGRYRSQREGTVAERQSGMDQQQRRKGVSRSLSGWALVDSALPSDDAYREPHGHSLGRS